MIAIITDRVQAMTTVEGGVLLIPPFEPLGGDDEQTRGFDALVEAVEHNLRHDARYKRWVETDVRPHLTDVGYEYRCSVAAGPPDRPDLEAGESSFEHVPDGAMFALDGLLHVKVRGGLEWNALRFDGIQAMVEPATVVTYDHNDETAERMDSLLGLDVEPEAEVA